MADNDTYVNEVDALRMLRTSVRGTAKIAHFAKQDDIYTILVAMYADLDGRVQIAKAKDAEGKAEIDLLNEILNASTEDELDTEEATE